MPPDPLPQTPVWITLPLPLMVAKNVLFVTAPSDNCVTPPPAGLVTVKVGAPVNDTVPKDTPAVPPFTCVPPVTVSVCAPIDRVPSVKVSPDPVAVTSDVIVEFAVTVVF